MQVLIPIYCPRCEQLFTPADKYQKFCTDCFSRAVIQRLYRMGWNSAKINKYNMEFARLYDYAEYS